VPEGDTIFRAARTLNRALAGKVVTRFETVLPKLQRVHDDHPVTGRTVEQVRSIGKWMEIGLSGDLFLLTHMLMSGSWHIYRPGEKWQRSRLDMRILLATADIEAVAFNVPIAEFHTAVSLARRRGFSQLGPDLLGDEFSADEVISRLHQQPDMTIGEALLSQSVLAGIGNVYKSEVCFACRVNPFRLVRSLTLNELSCLVTTAQKFLAANVKEGTSEQIVTYTGFRRTTGRANPTDRLWVYGRRGEPCRRCGTSLVSRKQGIDARITFWCPACQPE
jgi:endonuclease-8